jgi:hypothetical protein
MFHGEAYEFPERIIVYRSLGGARLIELHCCNVHYVFCTISRTSTAGAKPDVERDFAILFAASGGVPIGVPLRPDWNRGRHRKTTGSAVDDRIVRCRGQGLYRHSDTQQPVRARALNRSDRDAVPGPP